MQQLLAAALVGLDAGELGRCLYRRGQRMKAHSMHHQLAPVIALPLALTMGSWLTFRVGRS
jgi:ABC-type Mn2+/Zn2+ transport system permease subunit